MYAPGDSNLEKNSNFSNASAISVPGRADPPSLNNGSAAADADDDSVEVLEADPSTKTINVAIKDVLKGYGLFNLEAKRAALLNLVKMTNPVVVFTCADTREKAEALLSTPRSDYEREKAKKQRNYKSKRRQSNTKHCSIAWSAEFCAECIVKFMDLLNQDIASRGQSQRNSRFLPEPIAKVREMYESARQKAESNASMTQKTTKKGQASAASLLSTSLPHCSTKLDPTKLMTDHSCPGCGHYSLAPIETKEEIDAKNAVVREQYNKKMNEFRAGRKSGSAPRMGKTFSQTIACFCYQQNCGGHPNGIGCFNCEGRAFADEVEIDPK